MELPADINTVAQLVALLAAKNPEFRQLNEGGQPLLVSVNQTVADGSASLVENDEVAFFPPMTGG
jgi:molybdopterin converting factor small subunit